MNRSPLQINILRLYRDFFKYSSKKDMVFKEKFRNKIRSEFKKNKEIPRIKFNLIEYKLRLGKNQLKFFQESNVINII